MQVDWTGSVAWKEKIMKLWLRQEDVEERGISECRLVSETENHSQRWRDWWRDRDTWRRELHWNLSTDRYIVTTKQDEYETGRFFITYFTQVMSLWLGLCPEGWGQAVQSLQPIGGVLLMPCPDIEWIRALLSDCGSIVRLEAKRRSKVLAKNGTKGSRN